MPLSADQTSLLNSSLAVTLPALFEALVLAAASVLAFRIARTWLTSTMVRARVEPSTLILVRRTASISIVVVGTVAILATLGVSPATLFALLGAVGLALGLAVQDILKNFFSGVYLLLERPFRVGETIRVKDQMGTVENIGVRTTMLRTQDNVHVLVPNAIVFAEVVSNHTWAKAPEPEQAEETPTISSAPAP